MKMENPPNKSEGIKGLRYRSTYSKTKPPWRADQAHATLFGPFWGKGKDLEEERVHTHRKGLSPLLDTELGCSLAPLPGRLAEVPVNTVRWEVLRGQSLGWVQNAALGVSSAISPPCPFPPRDAHC